MKHFPTLSSLALGVLTLFAPTEMQAQTPYSGWPANYGGVMLQGFYWDSFDATKWTRLEEQADELSQYFDLIWIPQSAQAGSATSMGYDDYYWFPGHYISSFGTEAELRSMISTFKDKGLGTIADVVINHRQTSGWFSFPTETYNGKTYTMTSTDICSNDDGGKTAAQAATEGVSLGTHPDTGEGWDGMRDLDHYSTNVQSIVKDYLSMLLHDMGYAGFRYDMVKGYSGTFTGIYNTYAQPTYSVGEYWDGNVTAVENWLNSTRVDGSITSAAFDFPFRYTVRDAANNNAWASLSDNALATNPDYRQYAVTFVENHDTEYRSASSPNDPVRRDTLAANAYMLAMPGTPCVFLKHWKDYKKEIKNMIEVRKMVGVTNTSNCNLGYTKGDGFIGVTADGANGNQLLAVLGETAAYAPTNRWTEVTSGYHYKYYVNKTIEQPWADCPSGEYNGAFTVTLKALSSSTDQLVYTLDGTTPTATATKVTSGATIDITTDCTLKVALLTGTTVGPTILTRHYTFSDFKPYDITIYVNTDKVGWTNPNFWTWGGDGSHSVAAAWPGATITATKTVGDKTWYYRSFTMNADNDYVSLVVCAQGGSPQTVDYTDINKDVYLEVSPTQIDGKYTFNDLTDTYTGIHTPTASPTGSHDGWYTLQGVKIARPTQAGIYIHDGQKIVVK